MVKIPSSMSGVVKKPLVMQRELEINSRLITLNKINYARDCKKVYYTVFYDLDRQKKNLVFINMLRVVCINQNINLLPECLMIKIDNRKEL